MEKWIHIFFSVSIVIIPTRLLCHMQANSCGFLNFYQPYPSSTREWILSLLVYVLHKMWNSAFSRVVVQLIASHGGVFRGARISSLPTRLRGRLCSWRQRKCTRKCDACAKLLFCLVKLLLIWLSRRRRILNLWSVKNRIFSGQIELLPLIASQTCFRLIGSSFVSG